MRALCLIRKEPFYRRDAFERGLQRVGFKLFNKLTPTDSTDWLVIWNRKRGLEEDMANAWERAGGTVIVTENGYLAKTEKTHYAISVHGHNGSGWFPVGDDDRFTPLGFELKELWRKEGDIVIRAQRGIGSTLMASPPRWAEKMAAAIQHLSRKIRIAQHPGDKDKSAIDFRNMQGASELRIWSSAMGVRALVEGIDVCRYAPHWICQMAPWEDRQDALRRMSHGQWHFDEIATGEPFARIIARRTEAIWP